MDTSELMLGTLYNGDFHTARASADVVCSITVCFHAQRRLGLLSYTSKSEAKTACCISTCTCSPPAKPKICNNHNVLQHVLHLCNEYSILLLCTTADRSID